MMQKIYSFFIVFLGIFIYSQNDFILVNGSHPTSRDYCPGTSFNINLDNSAASSDNYDIIKDNQILVAGNTPFEFDSTDKDIFSKAVPLGFTFNFFGKSYNEVVIGRNGRAVFSQSPELAQLHDRSVYKDRTFSGWPATVPTSILPSPDYNKVYLNDADRQFDLSQIFFGYTDIIFNTTYATRTLYKYTQNYSSGGKTGFLISAQEMIRTDGSGGFSPTGYNSYVWILTTGQVIVRVDGKRTSFGIGNIDNYKAILGIQNEKGDKASVPTYDSQPMAPNIMNYNNGNWTSENITFNFQPRLKTVQKIEWFLNGSPYTFTAPANFTPAGNQILKAKITYTDGTTQESSVTFNETAAPDKPEFSANLNTSVCPSKYEFAITNPQTGVTYHWYKDGTEFPGAATAIGNSLGNYYVIADNGCKKTESEHRDFTLSSEFPAIPFENNHIFPDCDNAERPNKDFDLFAVTGYSAGAGYTVMFSDASGNIITNPTTYNVTSGTPKTVTMKVKSTTSSCEDTKMFTINYQSFPENNKTFTARELCLGYSSYSVEEFKGNFPDYSDFDVQFSVDGAAYSTAPVNPSANNSVFVKISKTGFSCSSVVKLNFEFYPEIVVKYFTQFPEHCASRNEYFDLNTPKAELEYDDVTAEFYENYDAATHTFSDKINNLHYRPIGVHTIYIKLFNSHGCTYQGTPPVLNLKVYSPPTLIKSGPEIKYSECGSTVFNLTTNISDYIGAWNHYSEIRYFDGSGARLSQSEWENYDFAQRGQPTMKFVYNSTDNLECANDMTFNLIFKKTPTLTKTQVPVCDQTSIPRADLISQIIGTNNYKVTDENGSALPENITWAALPATVKIILEDNVTHCKSGVLAVTIYQPAATVLLAKEINSEECDMDSDRIDGYFSFDLNALKAKISADANARFEFFDSAGTPINSPYTNKIKTEETVKAKVTSDGYCPSVATINLKVKSPSESSTLRPIYYLCAGELTIDAGSENNIFAWSDGQTTQVAKFTKAGNYSVTLTNSEVCSYTHNFTISDEDQPKITSINQTSDKIEVTAEGGEKPYTYYFNGISNGNNPVLLYPTAPEYIIRVVSAKGCYGEDKSVYFITVNNVITPNGDGKNDIWKIENLNHPQMENVEVIIADRYGKTVYHTTKKDDIAWDGTYNGRVLPTASYWYVVKWHDTETKKSEVRQGWILLQNRD